MSVTSFYPSQIDKVEHLFDLAEMGEVRMVTGPPVFFEMAWTLKSFYQLRRKRIYECLSSILGLPGLEVTDLDILKDALELFLHAPADFSNAYIAVLSKKVGARSVATFNAKHFTHLDVKVYSFDCEFSISVSQSAFRNPRFPLPAFVCLLPVAFTRPHLA